MLDTAIETRARSATYEFLSMGFVYPTEAVDIGLRRGVETLVRVAADSGWDGLAAPISSVRDQLRDASQRLMERQYMRTFGHIIAADCAPYEGEYGQAHVFQKSQTLSDLSTFYNAWGVSLSPDAKERLDHISVEMEFMHLLSLKEAHASTSSPDMVSLCRQAEESFLALHLSNWIMAFVHALLSKTEGQGIYGALGKLLETYMKAEFERFHLDSTPLERTGAEEERDEGLECGALPVAAQTF